MAEEKGSVKRQVELNWNQLTNIVTKILTLEQLLGTKIMIYL